MNTGVVERLVCGPRDFSEARAIANDSPVRVSQPES